MDVAAAEDVEAVERVLHSLGFHASVDAGIVRHGIGDYPWVVYVTTPIVAGFLGKLGTDVYDGAKRLVFGIRDARKGAQGSVVVRDRDGTQLVLASTIPDEAFRALQALDWSELKGGYIQWDDEGKEWRRVF